MDGSITARRVGEWRVPALGIGTWALGGEWAFDGEPAGWGPVDDDESIAALRAAYDGGVRFVDTADVYGCGHAERVVGKAIAPFRDDVVLATKVGLLFDEATRAGAGTDLSAGHIRKACDASLRRLGVDHIDVYQIHPGDADAERAQEVVAAFEDLVAAGKIRAYGTSATDPATIAVVAAGGHGVSVQQELNVFGADEPALAACDRHDLAVLARTPLAMGLLSGKYRSPQQLPASDVRRHTPWWSFFKADRMPQWLARLDAVRDVLTSGGRTLVQGALAYVWARSERAVALPGVRTVAQVQELVGALEHGPLDPAQLAEVDRLLAGPVPDAAPSVR
ncbi:MAG TPA: aldo/keto reductase [Pseudonocardia sp.]|jgi:aryl-alcohol dehydrogenase-like predicted oxidoreductase|uniref:aldo/keto reductase n=1 Tax=Pseudonocardia sp. TaxID=60912 RepID=UPI002B4B827E|nr:aldo/keto reductase [Pseudonocardia sp.]HLU58172.1 aldo/keto reductase [Pseudonocardia sp.]